MGARSTPAPSARCRLAASRATSVTQRTCRGGCRGWVQGQSSRAGSCRELAGDSRPCCRVCGLSTLSSFPHRILLYQQIHKGRRCNQQVGQLLCGGGAAGRRSVPRCLAAATPAASQRLLLLLQFLLALGLAQRLTQIRKCGIHLRSCRGDRVAAAARSCSLQGGGGGEAGAGAAARCTTPWRSYRGPAPDLLHPELRFNQLAARLKRCAGLPQAKVLKPRSPGANTPPLTSRRSPSRSGARASRRGRLLAICCRALAPRPLCPLTPVTK